MTPSTSHNLAPRISLRAVRAFTIIELLVVTAIIILLISILVVAVNAASRTAQKTRTGALMDSIKKGLIRFKEDVGYYPPILGVASMTGSSPACAIASPQDLRKLCPNSVPDPFSPGTYADQMQEYFSTCTIAEYLLGYGPGSEDGYGYPTQNENPQTGIRHPGHDGVWNASLGDGSLAARRTNPILTGKRLGPYLDFKDEKLLAGVAYVNGGLQTYFPGDALPAGETWDTMPKAIVDYWGMPIRYYRRPYPKGAIGQSFRSVEVPDPMGGPTTYLKVPTLSDVYILRPQNIKPGSESVNTFGDADGNNVSTRDLDSAEFALMSFGPDKRSNQNITLHPDNVDNIVEIGP